MRLAAALACTILASATAYGQSGDVLFRKDVKQYIADGDKTKDVEVSLTIGADALTITRKDATTVIPFADITGATYDRRARQRKIMGLPAGGAGSAMKLQHFLTVKFKTATAGDFVELELGKDIANRVVATLEAKSGKPVEKMVGG